MKNLKINFNKVVINKKFDDSIMMVVWFCLGVIALYVFHKEYYVAPQEKVNMEIITFKEEGKKC